MFNFVNCDILGHLMVFRDGFLIVTALVIVAEWVECVGIDGGHDFHHDGDHDGGHDGRETIVLCDDPLVWLPLLPKLGAWPVSSLSRNCVQMPPPPHFSFLRTAASKATP